MNTTDCFNEGEEGSEDTEMTYADIYSNVVLNNEIVITIPAEEEEKVKTGIKNYKAKLVKKCIDDGLPVDQTTLEFKSSPALEEEFAKQGAIDLTITMVKKGTITIMAMRIPENDF